MYEEEGPCKTWKSSLTMDFRALLMSLGLRNMLILRSRCHDEDPVLKMGVIQRSAFLEFSLQTREMLLFRL